MEVASSVLSPKNEAIAGAKIVTLKPSDKLEVKYGSLIVNGRPFEMTDPDESLDWPKSITDDGKLITWFKGRQSNSNEWSPSDISGYFTDQESLKTESASISEKHVQIVSLITEESDREIVKDFLIENDITGHESEISNIRNLFLRFKKYHSSNK
jgi:hypothetical protein